VWVRPIDRLDALTPSRGKTYSKVTIWREPNREKLLGVHPSKSQMTEAISDDLASVCVPSGSVTH